jgi:N-acetylated-alpha-linked acidic dipeptidase
MSLDFDELEEAILSLQAASEHMDRKKERAERKLRKLLRKKRQGMRSCCEAEEESGTLLSGFSDDDDHGDHLHHHHHHRGNKKWRRAVGRVRAVNQKLVAFERGFIHEDGIKGREWYRHLAIAPGKFLGSVLFSILFFDSHTIGKGYRSVTFPAIREAITLEGNATLAQEEVVRLTKAMQGIAKRLRMK